MPVLREPKECSICKTKKVQQRFVKAQWEALNGYCKMCDPHPDTHTRISEGQKNSSRYQVRACILCGKVFRGHKRSDFCSVCRTKQRYS